MSGIEVVGLIFASASFIQLVVEVGKRLEQRISELENPDKLVAYLSDFGVDSSHQKLKLQLEVGKSICNDPHVDEAIKDVLDKTFVEMQKTLNTADEQVSAVLAAGKKLRTYFVERRNRQALEASVIQLKRLAKDFSDTILLVRIERTSPSAMSLSKNVFQVYASPNLRIADTINLREGQLKSNVGRISAHNGSFVIEKRPYSDHTEQELEDDIKDLTKLLASSSYSEGILDIVGYTNDKEDLCFNLVFAVPDELAFQGTLRGILHETPRAPALDVRVSVCVQLAEAVLHVHRLDLVHKNISSANIAVMKPTHAAPGDEIPEVLSVFLLNWHLARRASHATNKAGETSWWKGIYCHPKRQMELAEEEYSMGHDMYSLGVSMLEVLTWKPLVTISDKKPTISPLFRDRAASLGVLEENRLRLLGRGPKTESELCTANPSAVQRILVDIARTELPAIAGSKLSKLVVSCLTCLEGGFPNLSFSDRRRVETGMNFIVSVKGALAQVSV